MHYHLSYFQNYDNKTFCSFKVKVSRDKILLKLHRIYLSRVKTIKMLKITKTFAIKNILKKTFKKCIEKLPNIFILDEY